VIVFPYAVFYRLTGNVRASVAPQAAVRPFVSGVYALVQTLAYRRDGVLLLVICAGTFYSRFLVHLIA